MNFPNDGDDGLPVSRAVALPFLYSSRTIYIQPGSTEHYNLIFEDISNSGIYPIVFLGKWDLSELTPNFVEGIVSDYVGGARTCLIITQLDNGNVGVDIFRKKVDEELPLINTEPIHSTYTLQWVIISSHEMNIPKISKKKEEISKLVLDTLN